MPIFHVEISMRESRHDYSQLMTALDVVGAQLMLDASWMLVFEQDINALTNALLNLCAERDGLFVVELAPDTRWSITGIDTEAQAWIAKRTVQRKRTRSSLTTKRVRRRAK